MDIEDNEGEKIDLQEISDSIIETHLTQHALINQLHTLILTFEAHLDTIIKRYKIMSITLLVAIGAAIGFAFSGDMEGVQVNKLVMATFVCLFGVIGLTSIWHLDLQVFHKFWSSFFIEEVKMEARYSFLVDVGDISIALDHIQARLTGDSNWYIFLNAIVISAAAIIFSFVTKLMIIKILIFFSAALAIFFISIFMTRASKRLLNLVGYILLDL